MRRLIFVLVFVLSFGVSTSAQEYLTKARSVDVGVGLNFGLLPEGSAGFAYDCAFIFDKCIYSKGHSAISVGVSLDGIPFTVYEGPYGPVESKHLSLMLLPSVTYHYGITSKWEAYSKASLGYCWLINTEKGKGLYIHSIQSDLAIGTKFSIYKPVCMFVQVGLPFSTIGLSVLF